MGLEKRKSPQILPARLLAVEQAYTNVYQANKNSYSQLSDGPGSINKAFIEKIEAEFGQFLPQVRDSLPEILPLSKRQDGQPEISLNPDLSASISIMPGDIKSTYFLPRTNEILRYDTEFTYCPEGVNLDPESPDFAGLDEARDIYKKPELLPPLSFWSLERWANEGYKPHMLANLAELAGKIEELLPETQRPLVTSLRQSWQSLEDQRVAQSLEARQVHGPNTRRLMADFVEKLGQGIGFLGRHLLDRTKFYVDDFSTFELTEHIRNSGLIKGDQILWYEAKEQAEVEIPKQAYFFTVKGCKLTLVPTIESKNRRGVISEKPDFSQEQEADMTSWAESSVVDKVADSLLDGFLSRDQAKEIGNRAYFKVNGRIS